MNVSGKRLSQVLAFVVLGAALLWPVAGDRISAAFRSDPDGCEHAGDVPAPENADEGRAALLCLLNARRAEHGLPPLVEDEQLESAAQAHAHDMSARRYFAHRNPDGLSPHERIRRAGFAGRTSGENLYWGAGADGTPAAAVEGWMGSPGHRANILRPAFRRVGTGISYGAPERGLERPRGGVWVNAFGG